MFPTLRYDLMYYLKNKKELVVISVLFISFFILAPFTFKDNLKMVPVLANSLLWLANLTVYSLAGASLYERDRLAGRLEYYQLQPMALEWVVLAKWLACYLAMLLPMLVMLPVVALLSDQPVEAMARVALGLVVGAGCLSAISSLGAVIMAGLGKGAGAILGLLVLPLSIPVIIFGADYTGGGNGNGLWLLVGFGLFLLPVMCLAGASSIRSSN